MNKTTTDEVIDFRLFKADNNLDGKDNLDEIPEIPAVYGIFGRINGEPVNCRFVSQTDGLRSAIKQHFSDQEPHACLKQFMQSIKIKTLNFLPMEGSSADERTAVRQEWEQKYKPSCTEELNKVH